MNALVKHIKTMNAKTQKWIDEDPKNRFGGKLVEDLNHWKDYGVHTPKDLDKYLAIQTCYEETASAYSKSYARSFNYDKMSIEEIEKLTDEMSVIADENIREEKKAEEQAITEFKDLINKTIKAGAKDEKEALRWLTKDLGLTHIQDYEHFVWEKGFLFTDYGRELVKQLKNIYLN